MKPAFLYPEKIKNVNRIPPSNSLNNKFIVYSDSRNTGIRKNKHHRKILNAIQNHRYDFICHLGDFVFWDIGWHAFFKDLKEEGVTTLFFPIRGNHDNPLYFKRIFNMETNDYVILYQESLAIFTLDDNKGYLFPTQIKNLEKKLEQFQNFKWKIIMAHKPLYSATSGGVRPPLIRKLEPLMKKFNVKLVMASHFHSYERLFSNGIWHIVSAGGGAPLSKKIKKIKELQIHIPTYNFLIVELKEQSKILSISAYNEENTIIDKRELKE